jgi:hypothetical protein
VNGERTKQILIGQKSKEDKLESAQRIWKQESGNACCHPVKCKLVNVKVDCLKIPPHPGRVVQ